MQRAGDISLTLVVQDELGLDGVQPVLPHLRSSLREVRLTRPDQLLVDGPDGSDLVHAVGWDAAIAADRADLPVPYAVTPPPLSSGQGLPRQDPERSTLRRASMVLTHSSRQSDEVHRLGVPWYRLGVLSPSVDSDVYTRRGPAAQRTGRARLIAEPETDGGEAGQILAALKLVEESELVLFASDDERLEDLRGMAQKAEVDDRTVVVAPGEPAQRAWWLRSADVAVAVPGRPEASPIVLESMACGRAVVATPVDELEDLLVHGVTGLHVPPGDVVSLARALRIVLADEFTTESYGMAASDRAVSRFSTDRVARDLIAAYCRIAPDVEPDEEAEDEPAEVQAGGV